MNPILSPAQSPAARPAVSLRRTMFRISAVLGFTVATAVAAQARFVLPDSPVPHTLQSLVVILAAISLGTRLGLASMILYLLVGLAGGGGFATASATVLGPTAGYLVGFVVVQPLVGWITRVPPLPPYDLFCRLFLAAFGGHVVIFACGVVGLLPYCDSDLTRAVGYGVMPFIAMTIAKIMVIMALGAPLMLHVRRRVQL